MQALEISHLNKTYKDGTVALKDFSLTITKGDFFALLGPNGAGKSTAIGIVTDLITKTSGTVKIFGYDIDKNFSKAKTFIGVVPQEFNFNIFEKVIDIIVQQAGYYGIPRKKATQRAEVVLKQLELWEKRNVPAMTLSGGMKRRLMIARALVHEPKILVLDEPTAGVDIEIRRSMWKFIEAINKQGVTIILTTHYLEEAESLCKNIAIINNGEVIENTSMKLLLNKLQSETFVLDLKEPTKKNIETETIKLRDETTLEVTIDKKRSINEVFTYLDSKGIRVLSMRNKTNRLEELFVELVEK